MLRSFAHIIRFLVCQLSMTLRRYITEVSPSSIRGLMGCLNQIAVCVGIVVAFVSGLPYDYGIEHVTLHPRRAFIELLRTLFRFMQAISYTLARLKGQRIIAEHSI